MSAPITLSGVGLTLDGRRILHGIDLDVPGGAFACVVGPSGCGKTTLLRLVAGLMVPGEGEVRIGGAPVRGPRRDVAVVFQDYGRAVLPRRARPARIRDLLARVGLADHAEKFPAQMSGGMQQRLQIARCLAQEPAVLLMDEPFGALDAMTRQSLQDQVLALAADSGATVFFVTHDLEEAAYLGDMVVGLLSHPGRVAKHVAIDLPRPRDQLATRELPAFLQLRRELFDFMRSAEPP